jgi:hypothetical protein
MPKVQTKNITKVFKKVNVKRETKNQTIDVLSDWLKTVNAEYNSIMPTLFNSELNSVGIDVKKTKELLKKKQSLTTHLTTVRSTYADIYNNLTNFSQLIKNPEQKLLKEVILFHFFNHLINHLNLLQKNHNKLDQKAKNQ